MIDGEKVRVGVHGHDNLFHGCVARTLANTVDSHLYLTNTIHDAREGVGCSQAEIIVAVGGPDDLVRVLGVLAQVLDHGAVLLGHVVSDRVGNVEGRGTGFDDGAEDLAQKVLIRASCVLGRELDIVDKGLCKGDGGDGAGDTLVAGDLELVLEVDVGGGEEGVDAAVGGVGDGVKAALDICGYCTGEASNNLWDANRALVHQFIR